jgi:hypothetical protein
MHHYSCYDDDIRRDSAFTVGGPGETDDHIPSKVLMDEPLPANLHNGRRCRALTATHGLMNSCSAKSWMWSWGR